MSFPSAMRFATSADLPAILELFLASIRRSCARDYSPEQIRVWTASADNPGRWHQAIAGQFFLLEECEGHLAGFASLKDGNYIDFMYVHPDFQRKGVARRLLATLEEEASRLGKTRLSSDVSKTARPFFEKHGYRATKENRIERDGVVLTNFRMVKMGLEGP